MRAFFNPPRRIAASSVHRYVCGVLLGCALLMSRALVGRAAAQCGGAWLAGDGMPGFNYSVRTLALWDPDGTGPRGSVVVFGGDFQMAGNLIVNRIASWDPATNQFAPLGLGLTAGGYLYALETLADGSLVAAGSFSSIGGVTADQIARWDGTSWTPLTGGGLTGSSQWVRCLKRAPNGDLVAGGEFSRAGSVQARNIARWNGVTWSALGSGIENSVATVTFALNGDVIAGGSFANAGGVTARKVARWNGTAWSAMTPGLNILARSVSTLCTLPNGDIVAGGTFSRSDGTASDGVVRWDGSAWVAVGSGPNGSVMALYPLPNGDFIAGGAFTSAYPPENDTQEGGIARWNGAVWSNFDAGFAGAGGVTALTLLPNGEMIAAGGFQETGNGKNKRVLNVARWDGARWHGLGAGFDHAVTDLCLWNNDLVAAGYFTHAGGADVDHLAVRNNGTWMGLGAAECDILPVPTQVRLPTPLLGGELLAIGVCGTTGFNVSDTISQWSGQAWQPFHGGTATNLAGPGRVFALAPLADGTVAVGGAFNRMGGVLASNIARWTGATWTPLGAGLNNGVSVIRQMPNGDLIAGGGFNLSGIVPCSNIARWNGSTWSPLFTGITSSGGSVSALELAADGKLIVGGSFGSAGGLQSPNIASWNGTQWGMLGSGVNGAVIDLARMHNGDIIACGGFSQAGGTPAAYLARWNGQSWSALSAAVPMSMVTSPFQTSISSVCTLPNGDLAVGGYFDRIGENPSSYFAIWRPDPPPEISIGPADVADCGTETPVFRVTAVGDGTLTYQWEIENPMSAGTWIPITTVAAPLACGGGLVSGGSPTAASTSISVTPCAGIAAYRVRAVVSNACGSRSSAPATLTMWASCLRGDMNCDARFDNFDIDPFVLAIVDPAGYAAAFAGCNSLNGDINQDRRFDNFDIDPFVEALVGP